MRSTGLRQDVEIELHHCRAGRSRRTPLQTPADPERRLTHIPTVLRFPPSGGGDPGGDLRGGSVAHQVLKPSSVCHPDRPQRP